jgi:hypothetical protein
MSRLFRIKNGFSVSIQSIDFANTRHAFAHARTLVVGADGVTTKSPDTTYELSRRAGGWRVVYQN